tara:strand:+ start:10621 stop:11244 length:624 start_codon:yes stop_codon:yes gene_type:complete
MHQLNVLVLGPDSFINTLNELKLYLKFNFSNDISNLDNSSISNFDVLIFHNKALEKKTNKDIINTFNSIKILATNNVEKNNTYNAVLKLPATINEINSLVENSSVKNVFSKNSSIKIKEYMLDKNEKKLVKDHNFIILTEKEVELLELLSNIKKPITKKNILTLVWHYAADADTHTVETHIYRLRKKIIKKFSDDQFILNDTEGYYL